MRSQTEILSLIQAMRYPYDSADAFGLSDGKIQPTNADLDLRKRLLAASVRITPALFPSLAKTVDVIRDKLLPEQDVQAYVSNSPEMQAFCIRSRHESTPSILITSALAAHLDTDELISVLGHEVGHCLFGHSTASWDLDNLDGVERLNVLALHRANEVSADRVGFAVCQSPDATYRTILKIASGLPEHLIRFDVADYLDQEREIRALGGGAAESSSTHPMFSVRLRCLMWFGMSDCYHQWRGDTKKAALTTEQMNAKTEQDLARASGFHVADANQENLHIAAVWCVVCLFAADRKLSKAEQAMLQHVFGAETARKAIQYVKDHGPEGAAEKMRATVRRLLPLPTGLREKMMDDLERLTTLAEGPAEQRLAVLKDICRRLQLKRVPQIADPEAAFDPTSLKQIGSYSKQ